MNTQQKNPLEYSMEEVLLKQISSRGGWNIEELKRDVFDTFLKHFNIQL